MKQGLLALVFLSIITPFAHAQRKPSARPAVDSRRRADASQMAGFKRLRAASAGKAEIKLERGAVRFATLDVRVPAGGDGHARALWFLKEHRAALRLKDPAAELQLARRSRDDQFLFFRRRHHGIPVFPGGLGVHLQGSRVRALAGNYVTEIETSPVPRLTAERAEELARGFARAGRAHGDPHVHGDTFLRYVNVGLLGLPDRVTHLAWRVHFASKSLYIDAHTGALVFTQPHVMPAFDLELETLNGEPNRSGEAYCGGGEERWFEEGGKVSGVNPSADGFMAFNNIKTVDAYFRDTFGRDGYDDDGDDIEVYVHAGDEDGGVWTDAHYQSCCEIFEFGNGYPVLDMMAHEFTHGVTDHEAELIYSFESGALNESFSDIFGHFVDSADWLFGEDLPMPPAPGGDKCKNTSAPPAGRDLSDPPCHGQPDHYSNRAIGLDDYGKVHTNSGIHNKAAFLLTAGGTHSGFTVKGIGKGKAQRLFYSMLTNGLWDCANLHDALNVAWYRALMLGFTFDEVCQVRNAYAAVGLGEGDADCDGDGDSSESDNDDDNVPDTSDNCTGTPNPGQENSDDDELGNACDPDADNDGLANTSDNCPYTKNSGQADQNGDGIGDVCQDSDQDFQTDAVDNCPQNSNYDQLDTDGDGKGDACDPDKDGDGLSNGKDNCPLKFNFGQADSDGDGHGDACDLCPRVKHWNNFDLDGDSLGDICDPDDDDDGVKDADDNCPRDHNPSQFDMNQNGIGHDCDPEEKDVGSFKTSGPVFIPVPICPDCGLRIPNNYEEVVVVEAPLGFDVRVVSSEGRTVADGQRGATTHVMKFQPPPHASTAARLKMMGTQSSSGGASFRGGARSLAGGPMIMSAPRRSARFGINDDEVRYYLLVTPSPNADPKQPYRVSVKLKGAVRRS